MKFAGCCFAAWLVGSVTQSRRRQGRQQRLPQSGQWRASSSAKFMWLYHMNLALLDARRCPVRVLGCWATSTAVYPYSCSPTSARSGHQYNPLEGFNSQNVERFGNYSPQRFIILVVRASRYRAARVLGNGCLLLVRLHTVAVLFPAHLTCDPTVLLSLDVSLDL